MASSRHDGHPHAADCRRRTHRMKSYCLVVLLLAGHLLALPVQAYSWSNCTPAGSTWLTSFGILPVPIEFGQAVSVVGQFDLARDVTVAQDMLIRIEHRVDGRLLPCLGPLVGSCTYDNVCALLNEHPVSTCATQPFVPCQCPYRSGTYAIPAPGSTLTLPVQGERFLGQNQYLVKAFDGNGVLDACIEAAFEVYRCEEPACVADQPCEPKYCLR